MSILSDFFELIPKKLIFTLLLILLITVVAGYVLDYLINYNKTKINEINSKISNFTKEYNTTLQQENFFAILQFLAIDYLASNKKYVSKIIINLPKYLPKNFSINEFAYNAKENKIILSGSVPNWVEYGKNYRYFVSNTSIFPNFKLENLDFNRENLRVILSVSFNVNYQELYK